VGDLIRDSLLLAIRRPLRVIVLPVAVTVGTAWAMTYLLGAGYGFETPDTEPWVRPDTVLAMPLLAMIWVALAWDPKTEPQGERERIRRVLVGILAATLVCLGFLIATELTTVGGVLVIGLLALLPSVVVGEPGWFGRAVSRSVTLAHGSRWRIMLAWGTLELAISLIGLFVLWLAEEYSRLIIQTTLVFDVALRVHAGLRWGLTIAVCVAAYRRLRIARTALDVDGWVEVFR
jgi:hypothetical protein